MAYEASIKPSRILPPCGLRFMEPAVRSLIWIMKRKLKGGVLLSFKSSLLILFLLSLANISNATIYWTRQSGNWNASATWSTIGCGNTTNTGTFPIAGDIVNICSGYIVTLTADAQCASITFNAPSLANGVTISGTYTLTVSGAITMNSPTAAVNSTIAVGAGTLNAASITIPGSGTANRNCIVSLSTGTINVSGNITFTGTANQARLTFTGAGILNIGGDLGAGGNFTCSTGTVNCNGSAAANIAGYTYYNLTVNKNAAATTVTSASVIPSIWNVTVTQGNLLFQADANYTINNDLTVATNGILTHTAQWLVTGRVLYVTGNISIDGIYAYTGTTRVYMNSAASKTVRTGSNGASAFCQLVVNNATGVFNASGTLKVNDIFYAGLGTTTAFHTIGQTVNITNGVYIDGGTVYLDGGTITVSNGLRLGQVALTSKVFLSAGTLNADYVNVGNGVAALGVFTHSGGSANVTGNLTIYPSCYDTCTNSPTINIGGNLNNNGTFKAAGSAITISGNWTNNASFISGTSTVTFNVSNAQNINGSQATSFNNLVINKSAYHVTLSGSTNTTVSGILTLTSGNIITGTNILIVSNSAPGAISGGSAGSYVNGNLRRNIATGTNTYQLPFGTTSAYVPVTLVFTTAVATSGYLDCSTTDADHPNIASSTFNPNKTVNRTWVLSPVTGLSIGAYTATFNWITGDQDAGFDYTVSYLGKYNTGWNYPTVGTRTATSIQVSLPTGSGFGSYQVGNSCVIPDIPVISATPSAICTGGNTTLSITSGNLNDAATWKWYSGTCGGTLIGTGTSIVVSPAVTTTYYARGEGSCIQSPGSCGNITVTVNALPVVTLSGPATACAVSAGNVYTTQAGMSNYIWTVSAGGTPTSGGGPNDNTVTVTWNTAGAQTVSVNYTNASGCTALSPTVYNVTVSQQSGNPTSATASPGTICNGQSSVLTLNGGGGGSNETIRWYSGSCGGTLVGTGNNLSVSPATTTTYYGRYEDSAPCGNTTCAQVTVTVNQHSGNPTSATATPSTICNGQSTTLTLIGGGGGDNTVIKWYTGSCGGTLAGTGNSLVVSPVATTTYYGRYEDPAPCGSTNCASITVTVNQSSGNPTSATATPATICNGQSTMLTLNGGGGGTGTVIRWYTGSCGGTLAGTGNNLSVSPATTTIYYGRYEDPAPCGNTSCAQVTVTVNIQSGDPTSATASPAAVCNGASTTLTLNGGGGGTNETIRWYTGSCGGTLAGTGNNLVVSPTVTTTYYGRYEDGAPCSYNSPCVSLTITVNPNPTATASSSVSSVCVGTPFNLFSSSNIYSPPTILSESFESGIVGSTSGPNGWTTTNTSTNGTPANAAFTIRQSPFSQSGQTFSSNDTSKFYLTNSQAQGAGGTTRTTLNSPVFSTIGYSSLQLQFYHYYRDNGNSGDTAIVEVSTNQTIWTPASTYNSTQGGPSAFVLATVNLNGYVNKPTLYIRFRYRATFDYYWAIDNVTLSGTPIMVPLISWTSNPAGFTSNVANPTNVVQSVTTTYTVTYTNPTTSCSGSASITVTADPLPEALITADYCLVPGKIVLYAHPSDCSYLWSTNETTDSILVDIVGIYSVKVTNSYGCSAVAYLSVATELVTNGDFSAGNTAFTSDYTYKQDLPGLVPPGQGELYDDTGTNAYSITTSGQNVHINFWGHDHTSGSGNFMPVNGHGSTLIVWKETKTIEPNTTYYFSAWAMSLNSHPPYAQLQFSINGTLVGTTAVLQSHGESESSPDNWIRFYGTWTSGPSDNIADIYIKDLQTAHSGNDFGLDDVSFGTLDPPPFSPDTLEANNSGPVCLGGTLELYASVTGGIGPFSYYWTGPITETPLWHSNLQNPTRSPVTAPMGGLYTVLISDQGTSCPGKIDSLMVTVLTPPTATITGADGPVCPSTTNVYNAPTGMSTYTWAISGNGVISGTTNGQTVMVIAGSACNQPFTLTLDIAGTNGCSSTAQKIVSVNDVVPPAITCPAIVNVMADQGFNYATVSLPSPTYSDNCTSIPAIAVSWNMAGATTGSGNGFIPVPYIFNVGITTITYHAVDYCGNTGNCSFTVTVAPNDPPDITCPGNISQGTDPGLCTALISPGFPTLVSGTPPITYTWVMTGATTGSGSGPVSPDPYLFNRGITTITWTAANIAGSDVCQQTVTVSDAEPPDFSTPTLASGYCVEGFIEAFYNPGGIYYINDLYFSDMTTPARRDYYLFVPNPSYPELDISGITENCSLAAPNYLTWAIDFGNNGTTDLSGTGQLSAYGNNIQFPLGANKITWTVTDSSGNTKIKWVILNVVPRPDIISGF
jgi:hypothetical protein